MPKINYWIIDLRMSKSATDADGLKSVCLMHSPGILVSNSSRSVRVSV